MRVKRFENGFILDPFTVGPDATLSQLDEIKHKYGFSGCPVTENGKLGGRLIGIITTRDHGQQDTTPRDRDPILPPSPYHYHRRAARGLLSVRPLRPHAPRKLSPHVPSRVS